MIAPAEEDARTPILLVDDIPENLFAMAELLASPDYDVVTVDSGAAALEQVERREFAVVLLDVQMPVMDGFRTAALMKRLAAEQGREIPVAFVTAIDTKPSHVSRAYLDGAVDFLQKPIDPDEIRSKVSVFVAFFRAKERLRRSLLAAMRTREDQMTILSHDLRNPLNSVLLGATQIERQADATPSGLHTQKAAKAIIRAVDRMTRLANDFLDLAKVEAGSTLPVDMGVHDLAGIVLQTGELQEPLAASHQVRLTVEVTRPTYALCDSDRVRQALASLIDNAIKLTPPEGVVHVHVRSGEGEVIVSVSDTGSGIPAAELPHFFAPSWQADARARSGGGPGMCLAKAIVLAQGGRIWVESAPAAGTTIHFTLPSSAGPSRHRSSS